MVPVAHPRLARFCFCALHLAEEASFSLEEAVAYRRVNDGIPQAEQLGDEGEARGRAEGLRVGICDLCEVLGVAMTAKRRAEIERLDADGLTALSDAIKRT